DKMKITYKDNGPGLPDNIEMTEGDSLGFTIINSLISQLNGTLTILSRPGFGAIIQLPHE
ncbi:MAG: ATP-binding protein, partial [Owenweeksia sp.]